MSAINFFNIIYVTISCRIGLARLAHRGVCVYYTEYVHCAWLCVFYEWAWTVDLDTLITHNHHQTSIMQIYCLLPLRFFFLHFLFGFDFWFWFFLFKLIANFLTPSFRFGDVLNVNIECRINKRLSFSSQNKIPFKCIFLLYNKNDQRPGAKKQIFNVTEKISCNKSK